jgi:hypothetical protein
LVEGMLERHRNRREEGQGAGGHKEWGLW